MQVYQYDLLTGEYTGIVDAPKCPESKKTKYLIPANATSKKLPELKKGEIAVFDLAKNKWVTVFDNRGIWYDTKTAAQIMVTSLTADIAGLTRLEPPQFGIWNGKKWVVDTKHKAETEKNKLKQQALTLINANEFRWTNKIKWERYDDKTRAAITKYYDDLVAVINGESETIPVLEI